MPRPSHSGRRKSSSLPIYTKERAAAERAKGKEAAAARKRALDRLAEAMMSASVTERAVIDALFYLIERTGDGV